jgi:hypothetical protein
MNAPNPSIIFIEVPAAGSPRYARQEKPNYRHHKAQRDQWKPAQSIPVIDREEIRRRVEEARKAIAADRQRIDALLGRVA